MIILSPWCHSAINVNCLEPKTLQDLLFCLGYIILRGSGPVTSSMSARRNYTCSVFHFVLRIYYNFVVLCIRLLFVKIHFELYVWQKYIYDRKRKKMQNGPRTDMDFPKCFHFTIFYNFKAIRNSYHITFD